MTPALFDSIANDCRDDLLRSAMRKERNRDNAEDLVQQTLVRASLRLGSFKPERNAHLPLRSRLLIWLRCNLAQAAYDLRHRTRKPIPTVPLNDECPDRNSQASLDEIGLNDLVRDLIARLPDTDRAIVTRVMSGEALRNVATDLGVDRNALAAFRKRFARAYAAASPA